eukprot:955074-Prymnesium_polylepis.1
MAVQKLRRCENTTFHFHAAPFGIRTHRGGRAGSARHGVDEKAWTEALDQPRGGERSRGIGHTRRTMSFIMKE